MADGVFNIALGSAVEMFKDANAKGIVLLLKANEAEAALIDHRELGALLGAAGNTEADFTGGAYARKTGLTATINRDDTNDLVELQWADQVWNPAGGTVENTLTKLIVAYENTAADTGRIPLTHHDFAVTTDGSSLTADFAVAGWYRAT